MEKNGFCDDGCGTVLTFGGCFCTLHCARGFLRARRLARLQDSFLRVSRRVGRWPTRSPATLGELPGSDARGEVSFSGESAAEYAVNSGLLTFFGKIC